MGAYCDENVLKKQRLQARNTTPFRKGSLRGESIISSAKISRHVCQFPNTSFIFYEHNIEREILIMTNSHLMAFVFSVGGTAKPL